MAAAAHMPGQESHSAWGLEQLAHQSHPGRQPTFNCILACNENILHDPFLLFLFNSQLWTYIISNNTLQPL